MVLPTLVSLESHLGLQRRYQRTNVVCFWCHAAVHCRDVTYDFPSCSPDSANIWMHVLKELSFSVSMHLHPLQTMQKELSHFTRVFNGSLASLLMINWECCWLSQGMRPCKESTALSHHQCCETPAYWRSIKHSIVRRSDEVIIPLYLGMSRGRQQSW